jgi:hypothetical protein
MFKNNFFYMLFYSRMYMQWLANLRLWNVLFLVGLAIMEYALSLL